MGRPRNPILSRDRIVGAALDLLDETGGFTIPQLAKRLGVSMSSLYHHVANRAEIVEEIRRRLTATMPALALDRPWDEQVRVWARAYRAYMARHPHLVQEFVATSLATDHPYEALAAVLEHAGYPRSGILHAVTALDSFVLGCALDVSVLAGLWADSAARDDALGRAQRAAPWADDGAEVAFELGLDGLLMALRQRIPAAVGTG